MSAWFDVRVSAVRALTPVIREFTLEAVEGSLPGFSAGSHVQLCLPNGVRNAYSLLGDPAETSHYRIAVRRQEQSRGGSRYLHEQLQVGEQLRLGTPANLFALHGEASRHILVAGGIGITPFIAHCRELLRRGADFELHYAYRAGISDAYRGELRELLGERLHEYGSAQRPLDLNQILRQRPLAATSTPAVRSACCCPCVSKPPHWAGATRGCTGKPSPRPSQACRSASNWHAAAGSWRSRPSRACSRPWKRPTSTSPTCAAAASAANARHATSRARWNTATTSSTPANAPAA